MGSVALPGRRYFMPAAPSPFLRWSATTATVMVLALIVIGGFAQALGAAGWRQFEHIWAMAAGAAVLAMFVEALWEAKDQPLVFRGASASLVLALLQGWLGTWAAPPGLGHALALLDMVLALALLAALVFTAFHARGACPRCAGIQPSLRRQLSLAAWIVLALTVCQMLAGTEVRTSIDAVAGHRPDLGRGEWIRLAGWVDPLHRIFSLTVLAAALWSFVLAWKWMPPLRRQASAILALVLAEFLLGISLAHFGLPPASQVLHLGVAACLAAAVFRLLLDLWPWPRPPVA